MTQQGRRSKVEDIREILRVYQLTRSIKATKRTLKCAKATVKKYVRWAEANGYLTEGAVLPSEQELYEAWSKQLQGEGVPSLLETYQETIASWIQSGVPLTRIQELLAERYGWKGSYCSLKRWSRPLRRDQEAYVRLEVPPGEEAQVDFGYMGLIWDPVEKRKRKFWLFLMALSHSRHFYGEFVFSQDVATWIACHRRAFEFFGGVPRKVVLDNLKAAILKAVLYDPLISRAYRECAEHYGFIISPCRPGEPRHKGKIERGIPYVRKSFLPERDFRDIGDANAQFLEWNLTKAGPRIHGTTKCQPLVVFEQVEKATLRPLPASPFVLARWKKAKLHPDCHVVVDGSYYSAPCRFRGEELMVRVTDTMVQIFHEYRLIASHVRARRPGIRQTLREHYPPEKAAFLEKTPQWCLASARMIGPSTHQFITEILSQSHPLDGLRKAQAVLGLTRRYSNDRLEGATRRALHFHVFTYLALKKILESNLDRQSLEIPEEMAPPMAQRNFVFSRPIEDFIPQVLQ
jgi:transposase